MKNFEKILYTYKHRKVLFKLAQKYYNNQEFLEKIKNHDLDKMFMLLFYEKKDIENIHRKSSYHHDNELNKTKDNYVEMILDWESARYTKPDKPLNAYDTLYKFYPHLEDKILPILKELKLDKSTLELEYDISTYAQTLNDTTEEDIKKDLIEYINEV